MIFRDLGSDKIFGHIFNLAENLAETAVKNMFYGDDTFRTKSKPQKKYQSEPICLPDDDIDNIETRIYRMKKLGKGKTSSEAFLAEAEYMKDVTDCYAYTKEPRKYYKENILPDQMTLGELRTYYTWRTKIFNGKYEPAERLYLTLYLTELVLGIHGFTNDGTVEEMIKILNAQDQNAVNDNHIVLQYLMDYIILHETSYSYDKVCSLLEPHFKPMKTEYHKINREHYDAALSTLSLQSSYDFEHSRLMESNYGYLLPQCIDYTFHRMEPYLSSHQVDLFDLLFRDTISKRTLAWYPYSHNPFLHVPFNQQIDVTLPNGTHYERRGGNLYQTTYQLIGKNIFREAIGYVIKRIESQLRQHLGFRPKLAANPSKVTVESPKLTYQEAIRFRKIAPLFVSDEMNDIIDHTVDEFYAQTGLKKNIIGSSKTQNNKNESNEEQQPQQPIEVHIDETKLENIRIGSDYLRSVLIIEDEKEEEEAALYNSPTENNDIIQSEKSFFNNIHKQAIAIILNGSDILPNLNKLASQNGMTAEMLLDEINEAALDCIGDNIIDTADEPYIYEDYIDEIKNIMEEI